MKKLLVTIAALIISINAVQATESVYFVDDWNMQNYWEKNDKNVEKVLSVYKRLMLANKINERIIIDVAKGSNSLNASTEIYTRTIHINKELLSYMRNDDELAFIISHEIAHAMETYSSPFKFAAMKYNSKKYEIKSDLKAVDYMVKAGYNPVAAIVMLNKIANEPVFDWGFMYTHPKGSKRLAEVYKYIYIKYPQYLNSPMTKNAYYQMFENSMANEIKRIEQAQNKRKLKREQL